VGAAVVAWEQPALAACHAFAVSASPTVAEGGTVTVTVTRDGGVNPSNVDVSTVDGSARAGSDYTAVRRTVSFTTETQQSFTLPVSADTEAEGAETFALHLSNPGGCSVNTSFVLGSDAPVTIAASAGPATTAPPATTPPPPPPTPTTSATTRPPATTTTAAAGQAPTPSTTVAPTSTSADPTSTTTEPSTTTAPGDEQAEEALPRKTESSAGGSGGSLGLPAAIAAVLAAGGGGYVIYRRRTTP
jgi:hypothetical protein